MFSFISAINGDVHEGMPVFGVVAPFSYYAIPENEWDSRCTLRTDDCVIDQRFFFVRGCLEIPVQGTTEPLIWNVWVSLSEASFALWTQYHHLEQRTGHNVPAHVPAGPFFGWLNARLKPYPDTINLKTRIHLRGGGLRPYVELEPTSHPLAREQRQGISAARVAELYALMMNAESF